MCSRTSSVNFAIAPSLPHPAPANGFRFRRPTRAPGSAPLAPRPSGAPVSVWFGHERRPRPRHLHHVRAVDAAEWAPAMAAHDAVEQLRILVPPARGVVPRLRALTDGPATALAASRTAPITARRARWPASCSGGLVLVGLGVGVGRYAGQRSLFGFDGATWSSRGSGRAACRTAATRTAALAVVFALALSALAAWGLWRLVRSHLDPQPPQRRTWIRAIGAMWVAGAVATVGGLVATGRDDGVGGGWVAGNLLDAGDDVAAELTSGYVERPQPGGAGVLAIDPTARRDRVRGRRPGLHGRDRRPGRRRRRHDHAHLAVLPTPRLRNPVHRRGSVREPRTSGRRRRRRVVAWVDCGRSTGSASTRWRA